MDASFELRFRYLLGENSWTALSLLLRLRG